MHQFLRGKLSSTTTCRLKNKACLDVVVDGQKRGPHQVPVEGQGVYPRLLPDLGAGVGVALQEPAVQGHTAVLVDDVALADQHRKLVRPAAAAHDPDIVRTSLWNREKWQLLTEVFFFD